MNRKKVGLVLGSGGVRGLAHIGVIKALIENNIPIDYIVGSSIGSWVGAHYALYQDIEKTAEFTVGRKKEKLFSFLEPGMGGGLIKGKKMESMLNDWLKHSDFKDLKIPVQMLATDLISGEQVILSQGNLAAAARASMSVPGIFKPVKLKNQLLIDGGVSNPVPDDIAKKMGADIIIAVNLDFYQNVENINIEKAKLGEIGQRTIEIMRHYLAKYSIKDADFIIQPPLWKYSSWSEYFTKNNGKKIVKIGELETEKIIKNIKNAVGQIN